MGSEWPDNLGDDPQLIEPDIPAEEDYSRHRYEPDVNEQGVAFIFTGRGGYVPCVHCGRDSDNDIHIKEEVE